MLRQFRDHHRSGVDELSTLAAAPDPTPLQQLAHSLKGSASAVGAFALASLAERVEAGGADGLALADLQQSLTRVMQAIDRHLASGAMPAQALLPTLPAHEREHLLALLEGGDFDAIAVARRLAPQLAQLHPAAAREIDAAMSAFDFERALTALRGLG